MQSTLRWFILTVVGLFVIWFMIMTVDIYVFLHTDADDVVFGTVPMNRTDIADRCGTEYVNSGTMVDFKLNGGGQIVYLCPLGLSPIRSKVTAVTLPDAFRKILTPAQQIKVIATYPMTVQSLTPPAAQPSNANPTPDTTAPVAAPAEPMSNTPPPVQNNSTPAPTPAAAP
ncbi:MAG: hypothetical protein V4501_02160 [Pseudomonadota bacterium]